MQDNIFTYLLIYQDKEPNEIRISYTRVTWPRGQQHMSWEQLKWSDSIDWKQFFQ